MSTNKCLYLSKANKLLNSIKKYFKPYTMEQSQNQSKLLKEMDPSLLIPVLPLLKDYFSLIFGTTLPKLVGSIGQQ